MANLKGPLKYIIIGYLKNYTLQLLIQEIGIKNIVILLILTSL